MNSVAKPKKKHVPQQGEIKFKDYIIDEGVRLLGTIQVFILHIVWFCVWMFFDLDINVLTFIVSLEAILLSLLILMSENRQSRFDRERAWADLEIDREAEKENRHQIEMIREIGEKLGINDFEVDKTKDKNDD
jgi:uncharacterized membrane protein